MIGTNVWQKLASVALLAVTSTAPALSATWTVNASGFSFTPANVTVAPGDTIHWVWLDGFHTVTSGSSCAHNTTFFNASLDGTHTTFDFIVPTGVPSIPYYCAFHCGFGMVGLITVQSGSNTNLQIVMDGDQEVPPVLTAGTGTGTATLDNVTNLFSWNISFDPNALTSAQSAAHFHGPAVPCTNAGVQIGLPAGSPIVGSAALTSAQAADVRAGRWYVNVHTANNSNGEIRGWVMPAPLANPIPGAIPLGNKWVRLLPVATGLTAPVWATAAPGQAGRLFVVDQNGVLWAVNLTTGNKSVFLDVSARLVPLGAFGPGTYDERGFLGLAFHPNYAANGLLYTFTSEPLSGLADFSTVPPGTANCQSVVAEWHVPNPADPNAVVDTGSRRELLRVDKPQFNHNGGGLNFGPDGKLYISLGDGGAADDRDRINGGSVIGHGCLGNGQNTAAILGKMIRIDPQGNNAANGKYGIPVDNPFFGQVGVVQEIYAYGLRNPWRYSFDPNTGALYCADVGQNNVEEIDILTSGGNYGWRYKEGSFFFVFNGDQAGYVTNVPLDVPSGLIDPIAEYDHDQGTAVIGGFVYRGTRLPEIAGRYVFGDYQFTAGSGRLLYLDPNNVIQELHIAGQSSLGLDLLGLGQDAGGELYVLANSTGIPFGTTGVVLQIATDRGDTNCDGLVNFADINPLSVRRWMRRSRPRTSPPTYCWKRRIFRRRFRFPCWGWA